MFADLTIRRKLILIITATSGVALLLASIAFVVYDRVAFKHTMVGDVTILANVVGDNSSAALLFTDRDNAHETLLALKAEPHIEEAIVYDKDGGVFARYATGDAIVRLPEHPAETGYRFLNESLQVFQPIHLADELVGVIAIQSDLIELDTRLRRFAGIVALFLVGSTFVAFLVAARLQRIISGPVLHLTGVVETVSERGDYSIRANKQSRDELGVLVEQVNGMLAAIQERDLELQTARDELSERAHELQRELVERKRAEEERQRLQAQIQHAQRLESIGILAGGIAHDFNNLLTGMMGHAGLALEHLPADSPARANIRQVELAAQRAAELTAQMLAYSGRGQFVVEVIDLSEAAREMADLLTTVISKKAHLSLELEDDVPPVEADASQIRQVVMNLITNASDSLDDTDGMITLRTGTIDADQEYLKSGVLHDDLEAGLYAYLEVADTGHGMDGELQRKIFDPFVSTKFAGRGLGLAGVLGIVRGHRGAIHLESEVGLGTTFRVLFPATEKSSAGGPDDDGTAADGTGAGGGTVLVVDDEEYVRLLAKTILEKRGYEVLTAENGKEAVDLFVARGDDIRVVLLDLTMPVMNGREAFAEMRRIRPDARIIISSGYSEQDAIRHFGSEAPSSFIQKPYQPQLLAARISDAIYVP